MGREVRDVVSSAGDGLDLKLIAAKEDEAGTLTEQAGEAAFVADLGAGSLDDVGLVFLAGSPDASRKALELAPGAAFVDLTYAAEDRPEARLRAPMVEPEGYAPEPGSVQVVAHPAAIALALFLERLQAVQPIRRAIIHVFEPASERGKDGIDELHQQTVGLFAFKGVPKAVFDEQLSFNLLVRYGEEAPVALEDIEARIERHLATLLSFSKDAPPMPSVRLVQAPVFHGHSMSAWVEFETKPNAAQLEEGLAGEAVDVREAGMDPPTVVGMAGQSGIAIGAVSVYPNNPQAAWFWIVADNLRLAAENAVAVARRLL
jgi:aspartate-semialdehyde dehydrogenase